MVRRLLKFSLALCITGSTSCEKIDLRGMFISYESVDTRFQQSQEWNSLNPVRNISVPGDDYEIFVMSDSHVGGVINLNVFVNEALNSNACAILMVGDLTTGRKDDYEVLFQNLPHHASAGIYAVVGNHDLFFNGWNEYYSLFGSSTYFFTVTTPVATDLYICLDSGSGTLGKKQISWLKNILENERNKYRKCIISTHLNLFRSRRTTSTNPLVEELHFLIDVFTKHKVDIFISGHDHKKSEVRFGNTTYITLDALLDGYVHAGYMRFRVSNGLAGYSFANL